MMIIKKSKSDLYRREWHKEHQTHLKTKMEQETAVLFAAYCNEQGKTVSATLRTYVYACIGKTE